VSERERERDGAQILKLKMFGCERGKEKEFSKVDISPKAFQESQSFTASILFCAQRTYLNFLFYSNTFIDQTV
jgi:hypothetical protein